MDVPGLIKELRAEADLGQRELARLAGLSPSMLSRYERGHQLPTLAVLDRLLAACGRDVRLVLVERHADLLAELAAQAAKPWHERCRDAAFFLERCVQADCRVLVAGGWAVALHGLPAQRTAEGLLLVPRERTGQLTTVLNATGAPWRQLDGVEWTAGWATEAQFVPGLAMRWQAALTDPFVTRVVEPEAPWPPEEQIDTSAGPLRVLAADALTPADGVEQDVLAQWRAWRAQRGDGTGSDAAIPT